MCALSVANPYPKHITDDYWYTGDHWDMYLNLNYFFSDLTLFCGHSLLNSIRFYELSARNVAVRNIILYNNTNNSHFYYFFIVNCYHLLNLDSISRFKFLWMPCRNRKGRLETVFTTMKEGFRIFIYFFQLKQSCQKINNIFINTI